MSEPVYVDLPAGRYVMRPDLKYDYAGDRCKCPACGGIGMPWMGWFACDTSASTCGAVAVVDTGATYLPVPAAVS